LYRLPALRDPHGHAQRLLGFHPNAAGMRAVADLIIEPRGENG
jgi:lysophospholipase L1-like esterase